MRSTIIALLVGIVVLILLGWYFSNIVIYLVISAILAAIMRPLTDYLSDISFYGFEIPRVVAVMTSFFAFLTLISLFVLLFVPLISDQIDVITHVDYEEAYSQLEEPISNLESFLISRNLVNQPPGFITEGIRESIFQSYSALDITSFFNQFISVTGNVFVGGIAVIFITFILLYEKGFIRKTFISWIPNKYFEVSIGALYKVEQLLSNYLLGLLFQMASIFTIASIGLSILNIRYALTIALFAAVANLIPYAGPLLGSIFGIVVGLSTSGTIFTFDNEALLLVIKIVIVFGAVQIIDNLVLQPLIFSRSVKAHPLEIFVVIFAGAKIAGVTGMILAIPVYTIIRVTWMELYSGYKEYQIFRI